MKIMCFKRGALWGRAEPPQKGEAGVRDPAAGKDFSPAEQ